MLASQEFLIKHLYKSGIPFNTLVAVKGRHEAELAVSQDFSVSLALVTNSHGVKVHKFYLGDQQILSVSSSIDFNNAQTLIAETLIKAGCSEEYAKEVKQSFHCVMFNSLMNLQQDVYLEKLLKED